MRVADGLKAAAVCVVLCTGCKEHDDWYEDQPAPDSGPRTGAGGTDSGSVGASTDAGDKADGGTASDAAAEAGSSNVIAASMGSFTVYDNPYGDGGANPAENILGTAMAVRAGDAGMTVTLTVSGLPAGRGFGSHVHKLECPPPSSAGGHFQHMAAPDGGANDPTFANAMNEVWLDFTTNDAGMGMGSATVDWVPPAGGAKAIVVHDKLTGDGGVAGPKLACLPFPF